MSAGIAGVDSKKEIPSWQAGEIGRANNSSEAFSDIADLVVKVRLMGDLLSGRNLTQLLRESGLRVTVVEIMGRYVPTITGLDGDETHI